jgi:hypothetical protein
MKTLYRFGLISVLIVIVVLLDCAGIGKLSSDTSMLPPDERDEFELYTLMGFEPSECDW